MSGLLVASSSPFGVINAANWYDTVKNYAVIVENDAHITQHNVYGNIAVGNGLYDGACEVVRGMPAHGAPRATPHSASCVAVNASQHQ